MRLVTITPHSEMTSTIFHVMEPCSKWVRTSAARAMSPTWTPDDACTAKQQPRGPVSPRPFDAAPFDAACDAP
jgi:hypothetical protein